MSAGEEGQTVDGDAWLTDDAPCTQMQRYLSLVHDRRCLVETLEEQVVEEAFLRTQLEVMDERERDCENLVDALLQRIVDLRLQGGEDNGELVDEIEDSILVEVYKKKMCKDLFQTHCAVSKHANARKARKWSAMQQRNRQTRKLIQSMEAQITSSAQSMHHTTGDSPAVLSHLRDAPRRPRNWSCSAQNGNPVTVLPVMLESSEVLLDLEETDVARQDAPLAPVPDLDGVELDSKAGEAPSVSFWGDADTDADPPGASAASALEFFEKDVDCGPDGGPLVALGDPSGDEAIDCSKVARLAHRGVLCHGEVHASPAGASLASMPSHHENDFDCGPDSGSLGALGDTGGDETVDCSKVEDADTSPQGVPPPLGERGEAMEACRSGPQALHKACDTDSASPSSSTEGPVSHPNGDVTLMFGAEAYVDPGACSCLPLISARGAVKGQGRLVVATSPLDPPPFEFDWLCMPKRTEETVCPVSLDSLELAATPATLTRGDGHSLVGHVGPLVRDTEEQVTDADCVEVDLDEFFAVVSPRLGGGNLSAVDSAVDFQVRNGPLTLEAEDLVEHDDVDQDFFTSERTPCRNLTNFFTCSGTELRKHKLESCMRFERNRPSGGWWFR